VVFETPGIQVVEAAVVFVPLPDPGPLPLVFVPVPVFVVPVDPPGIVPEVEEPPGCTTVKLKVPAFWFPTYHVSPQLPTEELSNVPFSRKFPFWSVGPIWFVVLIPFCPPQTLTMVFGAPPVIRMVHVSPGWNVEPAREPWKFTTGLYEMLVPGFAGGVVTTPAPGLVPVPLGAPDPTTVKAMLPASWPPTIQVSDHEPISLERIPPNCWNLPEASVVPTLLVFVDPLKVTDAVTGEFGGPKTVSV